MKQKATQGRPLMARSARSAARHFGQDYVVKVGKALGGNIPLVDFSEIGLKHEQISFNERMQQSLLVFVLALRLIPTMCRKPDDDLLQCHIDGIRIVGNVGSLLRH